MCAPNSILSKVSGTYQVSVKFFSLHGISEFTSPGKVFNIPIIYEKYCLLMLCHTLLTSLCALLAHWILRALTDSYWNCPHYADVKTKALTKSNSCSWQVFLTWACYSCSCKINTLVYLEVSLLKITFFIGTVFCVKRRLLFYNFHSLLIPISSHCIWL